MSYLSPDQGDLWPDFDPIAPYRGRRERSANREKNETEVWVDPFGDEVAQIKRTRRRVTISFDTRVDPHLADYVIWRLAEMQTDMHSRLESGLPPLPLW